MGTEKGRRYGSKDLAKRFGKLTIADVLHSWRVCEEMTLRELGKLIGLSAANLCDIEKGRKGISPEKAEQISNAIGVPPTLLVRLSIEESLQTAGLHYRIEVKPAA